MDELNIPFKYFLTDTKKIEFFRCNRVMLEVLLLVVQ